jgi:hypothetical protein
VKHKITDDADLGILTAWLDYAWRVASVDQRGAQHMVVCKRSGGAPELAGVPPAVCATRLPGYIGGRYRDGKGVLLVGAAYKSVEVTDPKFLPALQAAHAWSVKGRSAESDECFLATTQAAYEAAIPSWRSWERLFEPALNALGLDLSETAFVNSAKCWHSWRDYYDRNLAKNLATACNYGFVSLQALVDDIRPRQVLVGAASGPHPKPNDVTTAVLVMNLTTRAIRGLSPWPEWTGELRELYLSGSRKAVPTRRQMAR